MIRFQGFKVSKRSDQTQESLDRLVCMCRCNHHSVRHRLCLDAMDTKFNLDYLFNENTDFLPIIPNYLEDFFFLRKKIDFGPQIY